MRTRDHRSAPRVRERVRPPVKPEMTIKEELDYLRDRGWFHGENHEARIFELITMLKEGHTYE